MVNRYSFVISEEGWEIIDNLIEELSILGSHRAKFQDYIEGLYAVLFSSSLTRVDVTSVIQRIIKLSNDLILFDRMIGMVIELRNVYAIKHKDGRSSVILNPQDKTTHLNQLIWNARKTGKYNQIIHQRNQAGNPVIANIYQCVGIPITNHTARRTAITMAASLTDLLGNTDKEDHLNPQDVADNRSRMRYLDYLAKDEDVMIIKRFLKDIEKGLPVEIPHQ